MTSLAARLCRLVVLSMAVALVVTSCDSGSRLSLQLRNKSDRSVRAVVLAVIPTSPPKETQGIDVVLGPGQTREADLTLGLGWYAETVRGYVGDRLVFCQDYDFSPIPRASARYSVEIVEGHISPGCQDTQASR